MNPTPEPISPAGAANGLPDAVLLARARDGEVAGFEGLMRRYNQRLYRAARAIVGDGEAEDVVQEAWVRAFTRIAEFEGRAALSTWLTRVAVHEAIDRMRRRGRLTPLDDEGEESHRMRTEDSAEDAAARREVVRAVERAVDELPTAFRAVFMLREVEDLDTAETAEVLGIPEATVKTRLHRARGLVRDALTRRAGGAVRDAFGFGSGRCDAIVARVLARLRERTTGPADAGQEGDY